MKYYWFNTIACYAVQMPLRIFFFSVYFPFQYSTRIYLNHFHAIHCFLIGFRYSLYFIGLAWWIAHCDSFDSNNTHRCLTSFYHFNAKLLKLIGAIAGYFSNFHVFLQGTRWCSLNYIAVSLSPILVLSICHTKTL